MRLTAAFVGSLMSTVCWFAQSVGDFRSWAASCRFLSRVWMSDSAVFRAAEIDTWVWSLTCGCRSICIS